MTPTSNRIARLTLAIVFSLTSIVPQAAFASRVGSERADTAVFRFAPQAGIPFPSPPTLRFMLPVHVVESAALSAEPSRDVATIMLPPVHIVGLPSDRNAAPPVVDRPLLPPAR